MRAERCYRKLTWWLFTDCEVNEKRFDYGEDGKDKQDIAGRFS